MEPLLFSNLTGSKQLDVSVSGLTNAPSTQPLSIAITVLADDYMSIFSEAAKP